MWPTHLVVTPRKHVESLLALAPGDGPLLAEMIAVIQQVADVVLSREGGCHVVTNLGGYQESKHLHWHVYGGDGLPDRS